jgi:hypothetical protein
MWHETQNIHADHRLTTAASKVPGTCAGKGLPLRADVGWLP